jgi:hypothetical protein
MWFAQKALRAATLWRAAQQLNLEGEDARAVGSAGTLPATLPRFFDNSNPLYREIRAWSDGPRRLPKSSRFFPSHSDDLNGIEAAKVTMAAYLASIFAGFPRSGRLGSSQLRRRRKDHRIHTSARVYPPKRLGEPSTL